MEVIQQFFTRPNAIDVFTVIIGDRIIPNIKCSIMFLFLQVGIPNAEGVIFLPDYKSIIDLNEHKLILRPIEFNRKEVILNNFNNNIIKTFYQFTENSKESFQSLLEIIFSSTLKYEENFQIFGNNLFISLSEDFILSVTNNSEPNRTYQITSHSMITFSEFTNLPEIKIYDNMRRSSIFLLQIPQLKSIYRWYILLQCAISILSRDEFVGITDVFIEDNKEIEINEKQINDKDKDKDKNNNEEISKIHSRLSEELNNFKINNKIVTETSEPILQFPYLTMFGINDNNNKEIINDNNNNKENHKNMNKMNKNEIINIINQRIFKSRINIQHYIPNFIEYEQRNKFYKTSYNKESKETFIYQYETCTEEERFILLISILMNGYLYEHFTGIFDIEEGGNLYIESFNIIRKYDILIIDELLKIEEINKYYRKGSGVLNKKFMKYLRQQRKCIKCPKNIPNTIPYEFLLFPYELIEGWFYDILYKYQNNDFKHKENMNKFTEIFEIFLRHYLKEEMKLNNILNEYLKRNNISNFIGNLPFFSNNNNNNNNIETLLYQFLMKSSEYYNLSNDIYNFIEYCQHNSYYYSCSYIYKEKIINRILYYLQIYDQLHKINESNKKPQVPTASTSMINNLIQIGKTQIQNVIKN